MGSLGDDSSLIRHIENEKGCIMDVNEYTWFDGTSHIVVALANQVQVFKFTPDVSSDCMRLLQSIDSQINVFKVNIKKIDEPDLPGFPPLKEIEYQVSDIMKSVTVYSLKKVLLPGLDEADGDVTRVSEKYRFPLGQWCTCLTDV